MRLVALPIYVAAGAFLAGGALAVARYFGPEVARELGDAGGVGFATGMARAEEAARRFEAGVAVSGRGDYPVRAWSRRG